MSRRPRKKKPQTASVPTHVSFTDVDAGQLQLATWAARPAPKRDDEAYEELRELPQRMRRHPKIPQGCVSVRIAFVGEGEAKRPALYAELARYGFEPSGWHQWSLVVDGWPDEFEPWEQLLEQMATRAGLWPSELFFRFSLLMGDPRKDDSGDNPDLEELKEFLEEFDDEMASR